MSGLLSNPNLRIMVVGPSAKKLEQKLRKRGISVKSVNGYFTFPGGRENAFPSVETELLEIVTGLRADKSNNVVDPCPQAGENIELDVVIGQFLGG